MTSVGLSQFTPCEDLVGIVLYCCNHSAIYDIQKGLQTVFFLRSGLFLVKSCVLRFLRPDGTMMIVQSDRLHSAGQRTSPNNYYITLITLSYSIYIFRKTSSLDLEIWSDEESTTPQVKLFQSLFTFTVKNLHSISSLTVGKLQFAALALNMPFSATLKSHLFSEISSPCSPSWILPPPDNVLSCPILICAYDEEYR